MDKQEYREILEEINEAYLNEKYDKVLMIAQEIDANKISDNHTLEIIADSYEQMGRPDIAREVLLIAYERTPMGRQMAYKLCDISIKLGDLDNAAEFYHDFCRMAPNDSKRLILKYEIGKNGGVSRKNLVDVLEEYCDKEMDEKYKYELANLYRATGRKEECIELCDEIMLWFADGAYAKKAEKLKNACLGIMQQDKRSRKKGTLSLLDDDNVEDISEEEAKQYMQPKSEEIFDDAPVVNVQRMEDRPLMNENISWRMPNAEYEPIITEPEPRPAQRMPYQDFDENFEEYYEDNWHETKEEGNRWTMIEESIQRGWTDPDDEYDPYWSTQNDYSETYNVPENDGFVEPVFGAHRPAHLRDDYVAQEPENNKVDTQKSPFAMPNRNVATNADLNANIQPAYQTQPAFPAQPAFMSQPAAAPISAPAPNAPGFVAPAFAAAASYVAPSFQPEGYAEPAYDAQGYAMPAYNQNEYEQQMYTAPQPEEPSLLGAKPFAFSIAPDAAAQTELYQEKPVVSNAPNISEKAILVKKPLLKVGPVNEMKYKVPGGQYQQQPDISVVPFEQPAPPQPAFSAFPVKTMTSSTMRQTSIPAPKTASAEPVKVVMNADGTQPNLINKNAKVNLGWDDNWGSDFKTWGSLNMNDEAPRKTEIDDEPDYFSTILEIPRDKPSFNRNDIPFSQQVPQTKFVELKSGTPFSDPTRMYSQHSNPEPVDYLPKKSGIISATSTVAAIASEPEENLTEIQKAIRAFGAGEFTTDDLLERDDLDLGNEGLNDEGIMPPEYEPVTPSDYDDYNQDWQQSEMMSYDNEPDELRRFKHSGERFDFEDEYNNDYRNEYNNDYQDKFDDFSDDEPGLSDAEKAILAFDAMSSNNAGFKFSDNGQIEARIVESEEPEVFEDMEDFEESGNLDEPDIPVIAPAAVAAVMASKKPAKAPKSSRKKQTKTTRKGRAAKVEPEFEPEVEPEIEPEDIILPAVTAASVLSAEPEYEDFTSDFDEFDDDFLEEPKKSKKIEDEWTDSAMPEENPVIAEPDGEFTEEYEEDYSDFDEVPENEEVEEFEEEYEEDFEDEEEYEENFEDEEEYEEDFEDEEEYEEDFEDEEEYEEDFEDEEELSEAEKAILAFEAANIVESEEEFDFDEDFDDVFNGEFNGEYVKAKPEEIGEDAEETFEENFEEEIEEAKAEEIEEVATEAVLAATALGVAETLETEELSEYTEEYEEPLTDEEALNAEPAEEFNTEPVEAFSTEPTEELRPEPVNAEEIQTEPEAESDFEEQQPEENYKDAEEEAKEETEEPEEEIQEIEDIHVEIPDELREELAEFFLVEGMEGKIQRTLEDIVNAQNKGDKIGRNLIVSGDPKSGKTYLTIAIMKAVGKILGSGNGRIAKVQAAQLRGKTMEKVLEKIAGSDLIIENVGYLDDENAKQLIEIMKKGGSESIIILEGNNLAIENLLSKNKEIGDYFKLRLDIDELSLPQWADIANNYAKTKGYSIGGMASLALHEKIDEMNVPTRRLGSADVMEIVDDAIERATARLGKSRKKRRKQEEIELLEEDFI